MKSEDRRAAIVEAAHTSLRRKGLSAVQRYH